MATPTYQFKCPKCDQEFERSFWSEADHRKFKGYCSRKCANSKEWSEEINLKRSFRMKGRKLSESHCESIRRGKIGKKIPRLPSASEVQRSPRVPGRTREQYQLDRLEACRKWRHENFELLSFGIRRRVVIEQQQGQCNHCHLKEWNGVSIPLEVDHINGDRTDHRRENLEAICPNCHALTPTWRGRGQRTEGKGMKELSDSEILDLLLKYENPNQMLKALGMSPRGSNYKRINKLILAKLKENTIPV